MANGKTVSLSDELARMLDEEVRHTRSVSGVEVSRAQVVAGILKAELYTRFKDRTAREKRKAVKP